MALIGSVNNQGSLQGQINTANGYLTGVISDAELLGGQVVGMRGLKGDTGDAGVSVSSVAVNPDNTLTFTFSDGTTTTTSAITTTTDYEELINLPQIEGTTLINNKTFADLGLEILSNQEIEDLLT